MKIIIEDCFEAIKNIENESIDLTFTSPPYFNSKEYSFYNSYEEYLSLLNNLFIEIERVTKEGKFFVINTSPVIEPRKNRSSSSKRYSIPFDIHPLIIKAGFEFIDDIIWEKPEPSAKNRISGFNRFRKPMTYKPNIVSEYIMVYRKKTDKLIDWNLKQYDKETIEKSLVKEKIERSNIWKMSPKRDKNHPAPFPNKLAHNIIKYYSFVGDTIFDPFAGSGTVGIEATKLKRKSILIEQNKEYMKHLL